MIERYTTLAGESRFEPDKIKGSRFVACLAPAADAEAAEAFVARVREEFDDARHVCSAWRCGPEGERTRANDDGEPSGSAGRPILAQLVGHEVTDACCAVARYFGGVKLGVGGLVRAYGGAAGRALDRAELVTVEVRVAFDCVHPYDDSGAVQGLLAAYGVVPEEAAYGADVRFVARVGAARAEEFRAEFVDRTAGRGRAEPRLEAPEE